MKAYLVAHFDTSSGVPVFRGCQSYSESARSLTGAIGRDSFAFDVVEADGVDFTSALENLNSIRKAPAGDAVFGWAFASQRGEKP